MGYFRSHSWLDKVSDRGKRTILSLVINILVCLSAVCPPSYIRSRVIRLKNFVCHKITKAIELLWDYHGAVSLNKIKNFMYWHRMIHFKNGLHVQTQVNFVWLFCDVCTLNHLFDVVRVAVYFCIITAEA